MFGEHLRGRVVEDEGGWQRQPGGVGERVAQLDGGQRVEAHVAEGAAGLDVARRRETEGGRGVRADQVEQRTAALGGTLAPQTAGQLVVAGGGRGGRTVPDLGQLGEQGAGPARGELVGEAYPVDVRDRDGHVVVVHGAGQGGDGLIRVHRAQTAAFEVAAGGVVGGDAHLGPGAPGDGETGEAAGAAGFDEGVEVRVGGGVRGLPATAPHARDRGEDDEQVEVGVAEQRVEVGRTGRLARDDGGEPGQLGGLEFERVADPGGVHHTGQRVRVDDLGEGRPVGDVAGDHGDPCARLGQLGGQGVDAGGGGSATTGEDQVARAASGEPAGDLGSERAGATGDQHGAAGLPGAGGAGDGGGDEAAGVHPGGSDRDLVLAALGEHGGEPGAGAGVELGGEVDQAAPALRDLQRGDPAEAPQRGLLDVAGGAGVPGGDRAAGGDPERRVEAGVAERLDE
ncbi:hypothetical protein GCM10010435_24050 [Winogradskya consettensis]